MAALAAADTITAQVTHANRREPLIVAARVRIVLKGRFLSVIPRSEGIGELEADRPRWVAPLRSALCEADAARRLGTVAVEDTSPSVCRGALIGLTRPRRLRARQASPEAG